MQDKEQFENKINLKNLSHAYLLKTNDFSKVISMVKQTFKENGKTIENIDYLIDNDLYQDLKIIKPEGQWIKKEQIADLKEEYKTKSNYNGLRIYVIKNAENLNKSAANTMLKFLEEPEPNIIALLVTENITKVLETIVSRCQYIVLDSNSEVDEIIDTNVLNLFELLELNGCKATFELFDIINKYEDRNEIRKLFIDLLMLYEKFLFYKLNINTTNDQFQNLFDNFDKNNKIEDIKKKIVSLMLAVDSLEYNVNIKLLVDKLLLSMFGVD